MHMALIEKNKPNDFLVEETRAIVVYAGNVEITEEIQGEVTRGQTEKTTEETEKTKETEVTEECKITDLMSIPTIEENDSDLELPEESSTTDLQEEISQIVSPVM